MEYEKGDWQIDSRMVEKIFGRLVLGSIRFATLRQRRFFEKTGCEKNRLLILVPIESRQAEWSGKPWNHFTVLVKHLFYDCIDWSCILCCFCCPLGECKTIEAFCRSLG